MDVRGLVVPYFESLAVEARARIAALCTPVTNRQVRFQKKRGPRVVETGVSPTASVLKHIFLATWLLFTLLCATYVVYHHALKAPLQAQLEQLASEAHAREEICLDAFQAVEVVNEVLFAPRHPDQPFPLLHGVPPPLAGNCSHEAAWSRLVNTQSSEVHLLAQALQHARLEGQFTTTTSSWPIPPAGFGLELQVHRVTGIFTPLLLCCYIAVRKPFLLMILSLLRSIPRLRSTESRPEGVAVLCLNFRATQMTIMRPQTVTFTRCLAQER